MRKVASILILIFCGCGTLTSIMDPDTPAMVVLRAQKQKVVVIPNATCKKIIPLPNLVFSSEKRRRNLDNDLWGYQSGSGFVANPTTIITVRHLFHGPMPEDPPMAVVGESWCRDAKVVRLLPGTDILKLRIAPVPEKGLRLAENNPSPGDKIFIIKRDRTIAKRNAFSQVGAPPPNNINMVFEDPPFFASRDASEAGDSGSPIVNEAGELVGMVIGRMGKITIWRGKKIIHSSGWYGVYLSVRAIREIMK